jgi:hypothetical protein
LFNNIIILNGKILYNPYSDISLNDFKSDLIYWTEDIFQIEIFNYIVDVGFYPEMSQNGRFKIYIIKDNNWDSPEKVISIKKVDSLDKNIQSMIFYIMKLLKLCPKIFCFNWINESSFFNDGIFNSFQESINNLTYSEKGLCSSNFNECKRKSNYNGNINQKDFYEPHDLFHKKYNLSLNYFR